MTTINLHKVPFKVINGVIYVSEKYTTFATTYKLISNKTGAEMIFEFTHSTGPEFDPKTEWVYESSVGVKLHICNDAHIAKRAMANYLSAKLNK
jgi:hypothetical protein